MPDTGSLWSKSFYFFSRTIVCFVFQEILKLYLSLYSLHTSRNCFLFGRFWNKKCKKFEWIFLSIKSVNIYITCQRWDFLSINNVSAYLEKFSIVSCFRFFLGAKSFKLYNKGLYCNLICLKASLMADAWWAEYISVHEGKLNLC